MSWILDVAFDIDADPMDVASERRTPRLSLSRILPVAGLALVALFAASWSNLLPGGFALREMFEPDHARELRQRAQHAAERMHAFALENPGVAPGSIVFLGSSTIERFPLKDCFAHRPCVNRGIDSQSAVELVDRLDAQLPSAQPAGIVLYTGAIDWREGRTPADELVRRVDAVLARLHELAPETPIALLGILPARDMETVEVSRLARANTALGDLAVRRGIAFVSTARTPIASPRGSLVEEFAVDAFHLNAQGYRHLARWIVDDGGRVGRTLAP